jgi:hypothetical protein
MRRGPLRLRGAAPAGIRSRGAVRELTVPRPRRFHHSGRRGRGNHSVSLLGLLRRLPRAGGGVPRSDAEAQAGTSTRRRGGPVQGPIPWCTPDAPDTRQGPNPTNNEGILPTAAIPCYACLPRRSCRSAPHRSRSPQSYDVSRTGPPPPPRGRGPRSWAPSPTATPGQGPALTRYPDRPGVGRRLVAPQAGHGRSVAASALRTDGHVATSRLAGRCSGDVARSQDRQRYDGHLSDATGHCRAAPQPCRIA